MPVYAVEMECIVRKTVICENCTLEQAKKEPWRYMEEEIEGELLDWEVLAVGEIK